MTQEAPRFTSFSEFADVARAAVTGDDAARNRLIGLASAYPTSAPHGGYLIPPEFARGIYDAVQAMTQRDIEIGWRTARAGKGIRRHCRKLKQRGAWRGGPVSPRFYAPKNGLMNSHD